MSLNLDAMPVIRDVLFAITKRLEGTLKELSLRYCMELEGKDLIDLLKLSTPEDEDEQETAFPMNLEKLHVSQSCTFLRFLIDLIRFYHSDCQADAM